MPSRNIYKEYVAESFYHIYNRGVNKAPIFLDDQDREVFIGLLKRYLGKDAETRSNREPHPNYHDQIELLAFCLMKNHFHLCIYQHTEQAIKSLMKSLSVAYSMYFNKRYKRIGPIFQQRYRAVRIMDDSQLLHISRYIHMNPLDYRSFAWSSLPYYLRERSAAWMRPERIIDLFEGTHYLDFLAEYENRRDELNTLKAELADA
jgi:putative transposase